MQHANIILKMPKVFSTNVIVARLERRGYLFLKMMKMSSLNMYFLGGFVYFWAEQQLVLLPYNKKIWCLNALSLFLCGICMFFLSEDMRGVIQKLDLK